MTYTDQEKTAIITQYRRGKPIQELCAEYGICTRTIYRWAKIYCQVVQDEKRTCTVKEYDALLRRLAKLENIVAVLQTVGCTIHAPLKERLAELELLYGQYDVHTLCEAMNVSRGTFYNHILRNKRSNAWFEKRREEYCSLIREVFDEYRQVLGAEKIRTILVQRGHQVSKEYVARLMKEMGLSSIRSTAKQDYMKLHEPEKKRNVLRQQFQADRPNQIWVSDVTCFKLGELYLYTCVILDSKLAGVTFRNEKSGENRQRIIRDLSISGKMQAGTELSVAREPKNPYDPNAVAVYAPDGRQLGYIPKMLAAEIAPQMDRGSVCSVAVVAVTGGDAENVYGINIIIRLSNG